MIKNFGLALAILSGLSACGEELLKESSSPAYAAGYRDGCRTGSSTASNLTGEVFRDAKRYDSDPDYANGWRNGDRNCNGQDLQVNPTNPMEQVDIDGGLLQQ